jgi:hypothetical protein
LTDVNFSNDAAVIVGCDALPRGHVENGVSPSC